MAVMVLVRADDWEGLYVDGKLVTEGHSIDLMEGIVLAIEHKVRGIRTVWCDIPWIRDQGNLPQNLADVKLVSLGD